MAEDFDEGDKIRRWRTNLENPLRALKAIGITMVAESREAFANEKLGDDRWSARAPINIYGIIADFAAGKSKPPERRFQDRPVLQDSGDLANSIEPNIVGDFAVEVGSRLDYASTHQYGGAIQSEPIEGRTRALLVKWLEGSGAKYRDDIAWVLEDQHRKGLQGKVEARPFIGVTKQTIEDILEIVGVEIMEVEE